ncbi:MAG: NHL repeat-containing protein [Actinomycetes bacterium]
MSDETPDQPTSGPAAPPKNVRARRILAALMVVLLIVLGVSSYYVYQASRPPKTAASQTKPVDTKGIKWVRSIYGTSNSPKDLFGQIQAAVPGADGTIWITDATNQSSITKISPDGQFLGKFVSLDASSPISAPSRFAIGPDGLVYICETARDRIHVLTQDGKEAGSFSVPQPVSVAVSKDRIAVGSVAGFALLDKKGKPLGVMGSRGKGDDQFDYVHGIAFGPDGSVYVADAYNNRLSAYEPDLTRRWIIRTGAPANGAEITNNMLTSKEPSDSVVKGIDALQLPLGLTIDGAGRVVVAYMFDSTISVFDPKTGKFIAKYGDVGADDGQFFYPVSIGYDPSRDWFTVADAMNRRVQVVRIPGSGSAASGPTAVVNRTLAGPGRACILPLALVLVALVAYLVVLFVRRRRRGGAEKPDSPKSSDEVAS